MSVAAPAVPRNRPCPCGSGRKHKLCCGTTRTEQWELRRREEELTAAAHLAATIPLARPASVEFDAWADGLAAALGGADEEKNARLAGRGSSGPHRR
ncbi:MAG: SEC-C metal-binding domain-containing protein [Gaiellaceae bacterium]